jgi:hypothetical protein
MSARATAEDESKPRAQGLEEGDGLAKRKDASRLKN